MKNTTNRSAHRKTTADKKSLPFLRFGTYYLRYKGAYVEGFIPMFAYDDPLDDGYPYYELLLTHKRSEALVVSKEFVEDVLRHFGGDVQAVCTRRFATC